MPEQRRRLLYRLTEAASLIGVSAGALRKMCYEGTVRHERNGRLFYIPQAEIERLAGTQMGPTEEEREQRELYRELLELQAKQAVVVAKLAGFAGL
jgi:excisionase family DNA binding protein